MVLLSIFGPFQHGTSVLTLARIMFPPKRGEGEGTLLYNIVRKVRRFHYFTIHLRHHELVMRVQDCAAEANEKPS